MDIFKSISKFKKQTIGFVGIGSAPEFLEKLMWNKFSKKTKKKSLQKKGILNLKAWNYEYPITLSIN